MSGAIKNVKGKTFKVYELVKEGYIGVTTDVKRRMWKHSSWSNYHTEDYIILNEFTELSDALEFEYNTQVSKGYKTSNVRNQEGANNASSRNVIHTTTSKKYGSIKEACEDLGFNYVNVRAVMKNINNKYNLNYDN